MAAMSLGFIVMVTPWTIHEVVEACTGTKVPHFISFLVTWLALSNSFWNPFLYWLLNNHFRRISKELLFSRLLCRKEKPPASHKLGCCGADHTCPPAAGAAGAGASVGAAGSSASRDLEGLSEKYWGEILERTVSSNSLQRLQRAYGSGGRPPPPASPPPPPPPPPPARPNGIIPGGGRRFFEDDEDDDLDV